MSEFYANCRMLSPDGTFMCRLDRRRVYWYLDRNLAEVVDENPLTIRLIFQPGGLGNHGDPFYLAERENCCVVCGTRSGLTRHHCVPYCFRKFFPPEYKEHLSHDVLLVCENHHKEYETLAFKRKHDMLKASVSLKAAQQREAASRAANTLIKYGHRIPDDKKASLLALVEQVYGLDATDEAALVQIAKENFRAWSDDSWKKVVAATKDLEAFITDWRNHFVDHMRPRYLPPHWSVEGRYSSRKTEALN